MLILWRYGSSTCPWQITYLKTTQQSEPATGARASADADTAVGQLLCCVEMLDGPDSSSESRHLASVVSAASRSLGIP